MSVKKIAGVKTPVLDGVDYEVKDFSLFNQPGWLLDGVEYIKEVVSIALEKEFFTRKMELLDRARKKTTQKVNLYEKVQIPDSKRRFARSSGSWKTRKTFPSRHRRS